MLAERLIITPAIATIWMLSQTTQPSVLGVVPAHAIAGLAGSTLAICIARELNAYRVMRLAVAGTILASYSTLLVVHLSRVGDGGAAFVALLLGLLAIPLLEWMTRQAGELLAHLNVWPAIRRKIDPGGAGDDPPPTGEKR